jgi:hypothetical protein
MADNNQKQKEEKKRSRKKINSTLHDGSFSQAKKEEPRRKN